MAQVPLKTYLIVGGGRLASHLSFYLKAKNLTFKTWSRKKEDEKSLQRKIKGCDFPLLCLPDDRIFSFWKLFLSKNTGEDPLKSHHKRQAVHFSGSFYHPDILGFHPLMTFGLKTYGLEIYEKIPFVGIHEPEVFRKTFPGLDNDYLKIKKEQQALYHSLCVLAGNGTTLLWDLACRHFMEMGIENHHLKPYLKKVFENVCNQTRGRWSGPWYREDKKTVEKNKNSLKECSLRDLYECFLKLSKQAGHFHG